MANVLINFIMVLCLIVFIYFCKYFVEIARSALEHSLGMFQSRDGYCDTGYGIRQSVTSHQLVEYWCGSKESRCSTVYDSIGLLSLSIE